MPEWTEDVSVDAAMVRRLIRAQVPSVAVDELELVGQGWDVTAWRVDRAWLFRFPRRAAVVPGLMRERAVLPRLAPHLPIAVPAAVHLGEPDPTYPYPFVGARFLAGAELRLVAGDEAEIDALAPPLAEFLRALHAIPAAAVGADALPVDPLGRGDPSTRAPRALARLDELAAAGIWSAPASLRAALTAAAALPAPTGAHAAVSGAVAVDHIVHGDLHARQLLVDAGRLTGVIDWIDICRGDPALDLSVYWSLFGPRGRAAFVAAYGPIDGDRLTRARVLAVFLGGALAAYAHAQRDPALLATALASLTRSSR